MHGAILSRKKGKSKQKPIARTLSAASFVPFNTMISMANGSHNWLSHISAINWPFSLKSPFCVIFFSAFVWFVIILLFLYTSLVNLSLIATNRSHFESFMIFYWLLMILPCAPTLVIRSSDGFMDPKPCSQSIHVAFRDYSIQCFSSMR